MTKEKWVRRTAKVLLWLALGVALMGSSCALEFRDSAVAAGADFVGTSLGTLLEALIPIDTWVNGIAGNGSSTT